MAKSSPKALVQSMIDNLPEKTGKSFEYCLILLSKSNFAKHGEAVKHLKSGHKVTHEYANLIADHCIAGNSADLVENEYRGPKSDLRPIYDALVNMIGAFGNDVEVSPKQTYVRLRRNNQFALIQPSTRDRADLGINLNGQKPNKRLEKSGSFNRMVVYRACLTQ